MKVGVQAQVTKVLLDVLFKIVSWMVTVFVALAAVLFVVLIGGLLVILLWWVGQNGLILLQTLKATLIQ